jgi:endo-1,4-beta-xylanase
LFGAAAATYQLRDTDFAALLGAQSGIVVPEYELKRNVVEPERGRFDFSAPEALFGFARAHGMALRGHPLVWHAANPPWLEALVLASRDERLLTDYVARVAGQFRGRMHSWDVVNESLRPADGQPGGMRNTLWFKAFGERYLDLAFHAARQADPAALLVYNDFGCEAGLPENDHFRALTLNLLDRMLARQVPVAAYGMQGHLSLSGAPIDQKKLARFLAELHARGLKVLVTELDVDDSTGPIDIDVRDRAVADVCRRFLDVVLDHDSVEAVLTWGLSDRYLQAEGLRSMLFARGMRRLPFDSALAPLPMFDAMADALGRA